MGNTALGATHRFGLVVFSCLIVASLTDAVDLCDILTLDICKSAAINVPTGFAVKQCGKLKLPCGIRVTSKKVDVCDKLQTNYQDRAESICRCTPEVLTRLQATPALIRQGVAEAADPVTGITSPILSGEKQLLKGQASGSVHMHAVHYSTVVMLQLHKYVYAALYQSC
jgi:hypothetical protein